jgi:phasin
MTAFDIPNEMRNFAEKSMEQARTAFDSFVAATQQAVNTAHNQALNAQSGAREVGELAMRFAERNIASSFQFAQQLLQAKDAQEVTKLHTDYVNGQMAALAEQAKELSQKTSRMAAGATTSS